jgi:predicted RNase H-like nuclease (RuvC/YqgF family)
MENIYSVIITALTVLTGTGAWRYYEKRAQKREESENFMRNDCRTRIAKLEALLQKSSQEKDDLRGIIITLTAQVARLETEVKYLMENGKNKGL